ncbi:hypothetical protein PL321_06610 [Caloramator sp. mosi_1]|uniref:hypothetical protein n=1 Tax=Caloramator sp. mosi_1 TaxID=3023090 RepID=UPI002362970B|nr:hypothetical protein [Caloramator sp. mosi_1]WDC85154.1 hypothetical protein PL321_06610 [Caloramator sp. mosi_1]
MGNYYFDNKNRFIIKNFNTSKTFSSFLPGIAGKRVFQCGFSMLIEDSVFHPLE